MPPIETRSGTPPAEVHRERKTSRLLAWILAYSLFPTGLILILFGVIIHKDHEFVGAYLLEVGILLSAVTSGTLLHEKFLREEILREFKNELEEQLEIRVPKLDKIVSETASAVRTGLRLRDVIRKGSRAYYEWVNISKAQELFFAGRSVLHGMDADLKTRGGVDNVLLRKLKEGSKISILFLDPRSDLIGRLAKEEGGAQTKVKMLADISTSIVICRRLCDLLKAEFRTMPQRAELTIKIYDQVPYYAYHMQDDSVIIGFYYFSIGSGSTSPSYEIADSHTRNAFDMHFKRILSDTVKSKSIVEFSGTHGDPVINQTLLNELEKFWKKQLPVEQ